MSVFLIFRTLVVIQLLFQKQEQSCYSEENIRNYMWWTSYGVIFIEIQ